MDVNAVCAVEGKVCGPVDAAVGKAANITVGLQSAASAPLSPRASGDMNFLESTSVMAAPGRITHAQNREAGTTFLL